MIDKELWQKALLTGVELAEVLSSGQFYSGNNERPQKYAVSFTANVYEAVAQAQLEKAIPIIREDICKAIADLLEAHRVSARATTKREPTVQQDYWKGFIHGIPHQPSLGRIQNTHSYFT